MNKQNVNNVFESKEDISLLSNCCWLLSIAALWPSCIHTAEEESAAQQILKKRLLASENRYQTYLEICQRVLLTRQHMIADPGYGISNMPCRFFNSMEKGFKLSETWYQDLLSERKKSPLHKLALKALAEAVLEFAEEPTVDNFQYWKLWFIHNAALDEWMLYNVFVSYRLLNNK